MGRPSGRLALRFADLEELAEAAAEEPVGFDLLDLRDRVARLEVKVNVLLRRHP